MRATRVAFVVTAWLFLACVVIQFFLAGLGVFAGTSNFEVHRTFGYIFGWLTLVLLVLGLVGRVGRRLVGLAAVILVLFALQSVFIALRADVPVAAALHPVNGVAIFLVAFLLVTRATPLLGAIEPEAAR